MSGRGRKFLLRLDFWQRVGGGWRGENMTSFPPPSLPPPRLLILVTIFHSYASVAAVAIVDIPQFNAPCSSSSHSSSHQPQPANHVEMTQPSPLSLCHVHPFLLFTLIFTLSLSLSLCLFLSHVE